MCPVCTSAAHALLGCSRFSACCCPVAGITLAPDGRGAGAVPCGQPGRVSYPCTPRRPHLPQVGARRAACGCRHVSVCARAAHRASCLFLRRSAKQFAAVNVDQAPETPGWGPTGASQPATANSPRMRWGTARRASSTRALDARLTASSSRSTHGLAAWLARLRAGEVQQPTAHAVMETPGPSLLTSGSPTPHLRDIDPIASHARPSPTVSIVKATSSSTVTGD